MILRLLRLSGLRGFPENALVIVPNGQRFFWEHLSMLNRDGLRQRPLQIGSSRRPPLLKSLRNPERIAERRTRVGSLL
jgi:hypothetical protein